jgi:hypothetical protein
MLSLLDVLAFCFGCKAQYNGLIWFHVDWYEITWKFTKQPAVLVHANLVTRSQALKKETSLAA